MEWVSDEKLDYLGEFGLERVPFNEQAGGTSFFQDALISQRLGMLQHFSRYSDMMLLVTGEAGVGKTTLMCHFISQLDEEVAVSRVNASSTMDSESLLLALGRGFDMPPILDGDIHSFVKQLQAKLGSDEAGLFIIDDAHLLPADTLVYVMQLAELQGRQGKLLRVLLFAEPSIEELLADPLLARYGERISHNLEIPPLDPERCEAYINHRLAAAGHDGEPLFGKSQLKRICRAARGNPARINDMATEALLERVNRPRDEDAPVKRIYTVLILGSLLIAIASVLYLYRGDIFPEQEPQDERTVVLPLNPSTDTPPPRLKGWPGEGTAEGGVQPGAATEEATPPPLVEAPPLQPPAVEEPPLQPAAVEEPQAVAPVIKEVVPNPVPGSSRRQGITIKGRGFKKGAKLTVGWTGKASDLKPWQVKVKSEEEIEFRVITGTQPDTWTVSVHNPDKLGSNVYSFQVVPPRDPKQRQTVVAREEGQQSEEAASAAPVDPWLKERVAQHYTVQLLASRKAEAAEAFMRQHQLEQAHVVEILKQGQRWYYLLHGDYSSRVEADTVASDLTGRLRGVQPWVRSMAGLQQMMLQGQLRGTGWIRQQDDKAYSLQLVAGSVSETVQAFVGQHGLTGTAAIYQTTRNGKAWYVLIYGVYADQAQARAAVAGLPESVRRLQPWARSFASIKADLK